MIKKVIELSKAGTRLSIAHRQLVIDRPDERPRTLPCEDLGVVIVDHPMVTYTHTVFTALLDAGATVVVCGANHHPTGVLLPLDANTIQSERHQLQIAASLPLRKRMWRSIIGAKLRQQGTVLEAFTGSDSGLAAMAARVRSGDAENLEAQGAQRYWPRLFGPNFRRDRSGQSPNHLLNYGYTILRAAMARALVAAGLIPTLGIHHRNRYNPFCLADDALEPYRPYVDNIVRRLSPPGAPELQLDRDTKRELLALFNETIEIGDRRTPLLLALHATAASFAHSFAECRPLLALPRGLPLAPALPLDQTVAGQTFDVGAA